MSDTFHEQSVKAARKTRRCDWCGELIQIGQPYESYRWRDGWTIEDWRERTGRYDDVIAWKERV